MFDKIKKDLVQFQKPARYIGNELGIPNKDFLSSQVRFLICYPDVYEIGMSNTGIKILYDRINKIEFASCERVFSPWIDFADYLTKNDLPLFSLETKTPINEFDIIGISIQHELLFTNFLNILKLGKIEIFSSDRNDQSPIIILGGPGIYNPTPFSEFADLFYFGEGECGLERAISEYQKHKGHKARNQIIAELSQLPGLYSPKYTQGKVYRQIYKHFAKDVGITNHLIPNISIVQNKLVVEIMRGCPNKCRFCQAGIIYKPKRERSIDTIMAAIEDGLNKTGVSEVTLASLSSADYSDIVELAKIFNDKFSSRKVSFSLPSLRVDSFNVDILQLINSTRKSGLTFAVESGSYEGQELISKPIKFEKIKEIVSYASGNGWRLIKLYFMIGLPNQQNETQDIINFINAILDIDKKIRINVNLAVFVPKPHTCFQFEKQLPLDEALNIFSYLRYYYKRSRVNIKTHDPYMSVIEGIIARGGTQEGRLIYEAFKKGQIFDSWRETFNFDLYKDIFEANNYDYSRGSKSYLNAKWNIIDVGLTNEYYTNEKNKIDNHIISKECSTNCDDGCIICKDKKYYESSKTDCPILPLDANNTKILESLSNDRSRYFIEFSKLGLMSYIGHIDLLQYFERLFNRSQIDIVFTEGYNPKPKMQFSSALPLGLESTCEIIELHTNKEYNPDALLKHFQQFQHKDITLKRIRKINTPHKISLINNIYSREYLLSFDTQYQDSVNNIYNNFGQSETSYSFTRKNKVHSGKYQDYITIDELISTQLTITEKRIIPSPKIIDFVTEVFEDIPINITKKRMLTKQNENIKELFMI